MIGDSVAPKVGPRGGGYKGRMRELKVSQRDCARCFLYASAMNESDGAPQSHLQRPGPHGCRTIK